MAFIMQEKEIYLVAYSKNFWVSLLPVPALLY